MNNSEMLTAACDATAERDVERLEALWEENKDDDSKSDHDKVVMARCLDLLIDCVHELLEN